MKLAAVDCNSKKALTTCKKFGIEEIPTVKVRPGAGRDFVFLVILGVSLI